MLPLVLLLAACPRGAVGPQGAPADAGMDALDLRGAEGPWAPDPGGALLPVSCWVRVGDVVAWSYVDPHEGASVQWRGEPSGAPGTLHIRRLSVAPAGLHVLTERERLDLGLPERPDWIGAYGEQPAPGALHGAWRAEPCLAHRFHPDYPDDLRAIAGRVDGGRVRYEVVWVRLRACEGCRCTGSLLNQPDDLPGLALHDEVWLDAASAAPDRLPVLAAPGRQPDEALVALAASADRFVGALQDVDAWTPDARLPPEQRLPVLGRWGLVGEDLVFTFLGPGGPAAVVFGEGGEVSFQSLLWAPRGLRLLTEDEARGAGLPDAPPIEGLGPQPPPGPWGTWRVDPATSWLFAVGDDPDVAPVLVGAPGDAAYGEVRVVGCDARRCWGPLLRDAGGHGAGEVLQLPHARPEGAAALPLARPLDGPAPAGR